MLHKKCLILKPINKRLNDIELSSDKNFIVRFLADIEQGNQIDEVKKDFRDIQRYKEFLSQSIKRRETMSNKTYDILKCIALTMPIITTFIIAVMKIWNIPYATEIALTLAALNTLVAEIVKITNKNYNKKKLGGIMKFEERKKAPTKTNKNYYSKDNPFYPTYVDNCTWYAWGRQLELGVEWVELKEKLPTSAAENWVHDTSIQYAKYQELVISVVMNVANYTIKPMDQDMYL